VAEWAWKAPVETNEGRLPIYHLLEIWWRSTSDASKIAAVAFWAERLCSLNFREKAGQKTDGD
jgi:hypothetical protein